MVFSEERSIFILIFFSSCGIHKLTPFICANTSSVQCCSITSTFSGQRTSLAFPGLCRKRKSVLRNKCLSATPLKLRNPLILTMRSWISCQLRRRCFLRIMQQVTTDKQSQNVHPRDHHNLHPYLIFLGM